MFSLLKMNGLPSRMLSPSISKVPSVPALKFFAPGFQFALRHGHGGVDGQVAEVAGVPEDHAVGHAFVHVALVLIRQTEADDLHLAGLARLLHGFGRAGRPGEQMAMISFRFGFALSSAVASHCALSLRSSHGRTATIFIFGYFSFSRAPRCTSAIRSGSPP